MSKRTIYLGMFLGILAFSGTAFGWGGPTHKTLASILLNDPVIAPLIPSSLNVGEVTSWTSEPADSWHHPGWAMLTARGYLYNYNGTQNWPGLDITTATKYLIHIATDCGVPLGHSPAGEVYTNTVAEALLEAQVSTWDSYPSIVGTSSYHSDETNYSTTFDGTYSQIISKFYGACIDNAQWFKSTKSIIGTHTSGENRHASWNGTTMGLFLGRAMLADFFLAQRPTVANVASSWYGVNPGGAISFSSAGSYDPDSITWNGSGSYYNNGGGFSCSWDLNNDGVYETGGAAPTLSHADLVNLVGYTEGRTIRLQVADDDPATYQSTSYATATVAVYSNPTAEAHGEYAVYEGGAVTLNATGGDADGGWVNYAWDQNNDGINDTTSQNPTYGYSAWTPSEAGHTVTLSVTDNEGVTTTDTALVRVYSNPTANGRAQYAWIRGLEGSSDWDNLYSSAADADGGSVTTYWDLNNDGTWDVTGDGKYVVGNDFYNAGMTQPNENHTIRMIAVDNEGQTISQSNIPMAILVNPICDAGGPTAAYQGGSSAHFSGSAYDPDGGNITQYRWDINNDGTWDITTSSATLSYDELVGAGYNLAPSETGYTVRFDVIDNDADFTGGSWYGESEDSTTLYLYSLPTADAMDRYSVAPGESLAFMAGGWDADGGGISQWLWDLDGDGQYDDFSGQGSLTYEQLAALGLDLGEWLTIGLMVVDNEGQVAYDSALLALYPSILGDANGDGVVDSADYTIYADNYGVGTQWNKGDFNLDGIIDSADYTFWADNYGRTVPVSSMGTIPEPATLSLLGVGALAMLKRRKGN